MTGMLFNLDTVWHNGATQVTSAPGEAWKTARLFDRMATDKDFSASGYSFGGFDLSGLDLTGLDLTGLDLGRANLRNTVL